MLTADQVPQVIGSTAYGSDGQKIGKVGQVYYDEGTDQPEWVTVNTGLFGTNESFVPLEGSTFDGERLTVSHIKDKVKGAPSVGNDGSLSPEEEHELYDYYRPGWEDYVAPPADTAPASAMQTPLIDTAPGPGPQAPAQPQAPVDDGSMSRSEERLDVGTRTQQAGKARLRKWTEVEHVSVTVPVRKEMAAVETEPAGDATRSDLAADPEQVVVLNEERPVVSTTVEPVQRARIATETVTDEVSVSEEVSKERIGIDEDRDGRHA